MRRQIIEKTKDESSEKQKRNALVHSIAVESQILGDLKEEAIDFEDRIIEATQVIKEKEDEVVSLTTKIAELSAELTGKESSLRSLLAEVSEREVVIAKLIKEEMQISMSLRAVQQEFNDEMARIGSKITVASCELSRIVKETDACTKEKDETLATLSSVENQLTHSIADKKREIESLDGSIAKRVAELAYINKNIAENKTAEDKARQELIKVDSKIEEVKGELAVYDKQLSDKNTELTERENDVNKKREELVSLVMKEKKINEKEVAIRELFKKAGIDVKI